MDRDSAIRTAPKWCSGPCGRLLSRAEFYLNVDGNQQGECKACHRVVARDSRRKRIRNLVVRRRVRDAKARYRARKKLAEAMA